jgi:hypothetical protein
MKHDAFDKIMTNSSYIFLNLYSFSYTDNIKLWKEIIRHEELSLLMIVFFESSLFHII